MTPEAQRIAIAESRGWTGIFYNPVHGGWMGRKPEDDRDTYGLPDYLNNRDDIHEALSGLTDEQKYAIAIRLTLKVAPEAGHAHTDSMLCPKCIVAILDATSAEICEEYLRTLYLWKP